MFIASISCGRPSVSARCAHGAENHLVDNMMWPRSRRLTAGCRIRFPGFSFGRVRPCTGLVVGPGKTADFARPRLFRDVNPPFSVGLGEDL